MSLAEARGGFLYQIRPDVIPQGYLTNEELALWTAYYELKEQRG